MRWLLVGVILLALYALGAEAVKAHHNEKLPLIPDTPAIAMLWAEGTVTYALDTRASNYPGFREQVREVSNAHESKFGVTLVEVNLNQNPMIIHTMPDSVNCTGCAANVTYHTDPVIIRYVWQLGYHSWHTTISHELGHVWGLHEQYIDSGSIQCDPTRTWTIMSCGTGVWIPQPFDYNTAWSWLLPTRLEDGEAQYGRGTHPDGTHFIWYCNNRDNRSVPIHEAADRVAVMYWQWNGGSPTYQWAGYHLPIPAAGSCVGANVPPSLDGGCYNVHINQEISGWSNSWQRPDMRNDQAVARICP